MKKYTVVFLLSFAAVNSFSQINVHAGLEDVYRNFMVQAHSQFEKLVLADFTSVGGDKRFMSSNWVVGGATNNYGVTISQNYFFNYDFLAQELHAKWKDTNIVVNSNYVKRFFIVTADGTHNFVKSEAIDPQGKYFFESLAFDEATNDSAKVQILKLRTIKQVKKNKNDYLANFSGDFADELDNKIEYFIVFPDKKYTKVKLTKKAMAAALAPYAEKVKPYLAKEESMDETVAANLIRFVNSSQ